MTDSISAAPDKGNQPRDLHTRSYRRQLWGMLAPYLLGVLALIGLPALVSLGLAFTRYDALTPPVWAGLQTFRDVRLEPLLPVAIYNTLFYIFLAVPVRLLGALGLALLLRHPGRLVGLYRTAVYLPSVVPEVAYALIWLWIFNPLYGPLNGLLGMAGLPTPAWLIQPHTARLAFVILAAFQVGEGFVVLLAGLKDIPQAYYDAAQVDGANRLQSFLRITLPLVSPWLVLLTFRDIILSFQNTFVPAFIMTGGDPYYATLFLPLLVYEEAFDRFRFGQGSVMMLVTFAATLGLLWLLYWIFQGWGTEEG